MPLGRSLAENEDESAIIAMLLDDYYQQTLHAPLPQPAGSPAPAKQGRTGAARPPPQSTPMKKQSPARPVERLFSFVLRSRILIVGRDTLARSKSRLHFVLITRDLSENSRAEILSDFAHYPVVQHYTAEETGEVFRDQGCKSDRI